MQNRLVIRGIPSSVPRLPHAAEGLRDLVEENGCWVDRFVFLSNDENDQDDETGTCSDSVVAVAELHIENVRDRAVKALNGMKVMLRSDGSIVHKESDGGTDMDADADADADADRNTDTENNGNDCDLMKIFTSFTIHASPATHMQSKCLVEKCPIGCDDEEDSGESESAALEERMRVQKWILPNNKPGLEPGPRFGATELIVRRSEESGGTGTDPWRGGVILAEEISTWFAKVIDETNSIIPTCAMTHTSGTNGATNDISKCKFTPRTDTTTTTNTSTRQALSTEMLFDDKVVLELGAGSAGLPSMVLACISKKEKNSIQTNTNHTNETLSMMRTHHHHRPRRIITSDGIDEIVRALRRNISVNNLNEFITVQHLDWNRLDDLLTTTSRRTDNNTHDHSSPTLPMSISMPLPKADTIIFADCVYNEEGAVALCNAIDATVKKPGGNIIGVLPDYRVGLDVFERTMIRRGYTPQLILRSSHARSNEKGTSTNNQNVGGHSFLCSGGGGKHYRILWWRQQ